MKIKLDKLTLSFDAPVLRSLTTTIPDGKITVVLGQSGCGKTTLLRCLSGLEDRFSGSIEFLRGEGHTSGRLPFQDVGMVFQNAPVYPSLTTVQNLRMSLRKADELVIQEKVKVMLELFGIEPLSNRVAKTLSGGERQRVALAKALIKTPKLLLLDEPFSSLDYDIKQRLREEMKRYCRDNSLTTIMVTHDQEDAEIMADSVILMKAGKIEQAGRYRELYDTPISAYVANFIGSPRINWIRIDNRSYGIRPEYVNVRRKQFPSEANVISMPGKLVDSFQRGPVLFARFETQAGDVTVLIDKEFHLEQHETIEFQKDKLMLYEDSTS